MSIIPYVKNPLVILRRCPDYDPARIQAMRGTLHAHITTAREIVDRDLLIYAPKLKSSMLVFGPSADLKLNIGILCDKGRMWNHDHRLNEKVVDLSWLRRVVKEGL